MRPAHTTRRCLLLSGLAGLTTGAAAGMAAGMAAGPVLAASEAPGAVRVEILTEAGGIELSLAATAAPVTVANFLAHVDRGLLAGASFYRTVRPANDNNPATINVIQGGLGEAASPLPPIAHETTRQTGLVHRDGVISMARLAPGSASSEFFICLGDNPALDFGGARNPDGQGFAAFGSVVRGMEVVRAIHDLPAVSRSPDPYVKGQMIERPVRILSLRRL